MLTALLAVAAGTLLALALRAGAPSEVTVAQTLASPSAASLASLPLAAQAPVSAALGHASRGFWVHGDRASNAGLSATFAVGAVTVAGGAGHVSFGLAGSGAPTIDANRVTYRAGSVRAEYANGPVGLEQTFLLSRGSAVDLTLRGNMHAAARDGGVVFRSAGATLRYGGLLATDARGRRLPAAVALRGERLVLSVSARGAHYPVRIDPWLKAANLNEASPPSDAFGYATAVSGSTIAVSAPAHKVGSNASQGAVFVFTKPASGWANSTTSTMLTASHGAAGDQLGQWLSMNSNTIVASASNHGASGAAYVFVEHGGSWGPNETAELSAPSGTAKGGYLQVAISPDGDTIALGQEAATVDGHTEQGEVLAFTMPAGGWAAGTPQMATLTMADGAANDLDGLEVAATNNTIVAAGGTSGDGSANDAVYVFVRGGGGWASGTQTAELTDAGNEIDVDGSNTLSISPDGKTIVVGITNNPTTDPNGDALVFAEPASGWAKTTTAASANLSASDGAAGDAFGFATAASNKTIAVSAPQAGTNFGELYVFDEPAGGWSGNLHETQKLTAGTTQAGAVGYSLGFDGTSIVAGAHARQLGAFVFINPDLSTGPSAPPVNTAPPVVGGHVVSGSTLTCSRGLWSESPTGFVFQWFRDGVAIAGATGATYVVRVKDENQVLSCGVVASNSRGAGKRALSRGVRVPFVKAHCPVPSGSISGTRLGPLALGMPQARARALLPRFTVQKFKFDDFCLHSRFGIRAKYADSVLLKTAPAGLAAKTRGRIVIALTSCGHYRLKGVKSGNRLAANARRLHVGKRFRVGRNDWYLLPFDPQADGVLKVRGGKIVEIGIADKRFLKTAKAQRYFFFKFVKG